MKSVRAVVTVVLALSTILIWLPPIAAQDNPVVIRMWHIATETDPFHPALRDAIAEFNATHTHIQIQAEAIPNEVFQQRLDEAIAAGQAPDVFQTWGGGRLQAYVDAGVARAIPELSGDMEKRFVSTALEFSTFNGQHYAIPANLAGVFLWYNPTLFEQHQVALPTTWEQLIGACHAFRQKGIVPIALGNRDKWPGGFWFAYLVMRIGGSQALADTLNQTNGASFSDPAFVEAGARIQEAVTAGCFGDGYNQIDFGSAQQLLGSGQAAMQLQGDWNLPALRRDYPGVAIDVLPFPSVAGGKGSTVDMLSGTGQAFAIASAAPPETSAALIELLSTPSFGGRVLAAGFIPALTGYVTGDPLDQKLISMVAGAPTLQLYFDQLLPPALADAHLTSTYQLFDLTLTPVQAANMVALGALQGLEGATLRDLAARQGMLIGAAVIIDPLRNDSRYSATLSREFNMLTPEMALKWDAIHPAQDTYAFDDADYIVNFAATHGMAVRGHTLVWHNQLPAWLHQNFTRDQLLAILRDHIFTVVGRYQGRIRYWDVVNEAIADDGSLRDNIWLRVIGPEYIDYAFQWAHQTDPNALLFYNDFDSEGMGAKSDAVYKLVSGLVQRGVPIHGVGLQMHISVGEPPVVADVEANMDRLQNLGLQAQITEMDVQIQDGVGSDADRLGTQALLYGEIARVCVTHPACTALVTWGFTDLHTWIPGYTGHADAPLLFDASYQPKLAYYAVLNVLFGTTGAAAR
uniref:endo-1,4-beta-xylanase n=1 Tax=uncultured microorganism TaxID=358574 RepID=A0A7U1BNH7_9ZZZZ|nr:1,4-beta-xylanase [uncultured microorganism]